MGCTSSVSASAGRRGSEKRSSHPPQRCGDGAWKGQEEQPYPRTGPQGILDERVFDTAILLHGPTERILAQPGPRTFLGRRVDQIVEHTSFPRNRVVGWGIVYAILSARWRAEDGGSG